MRQSDSTGSREIDIPCLAMMIRAMNTQFAHNMVRAIVWLPAKRALPVRPCVLINTPM